MKSKSKRSLLAAVIICLLTGTFARAGGSDPVCSTTDERAGCLTNTTRVARIDATDSFGVVRIMVDPAVPNPAGCGDGQLLTNSIDVELTDTAVPGSNRGRTDVPNRRKNPPRGPNPPPNRRTDVPNRRTIKPPKGGSDEARAEIQLLTDALYFAGLGELAVQLRLDEKRCSKAFGPSTAIAVGIVVHPKEIGPISPTDPALTELTPAESGLEESSSNVIDTKRTGERQAVALPDRGGSAPLEMVEPSQATSPTVNPDARIENESPSSHDGVRTYSIAVIEARTGEPDLETCESLSETEILPPLPEGELPLLVVQGEVGEIPDVQAVLVRGRDAGEHRGWQTYLRVFDGETEIVNIPIDTRGEPCALHMGDVDGEPGNELVLGWVLAGENAPLEWVVYALQER